MASLMGSLMILLAFWIMIGASKKKDLSVNILDFMSVFNGIWNNQAQIDKGTQGVYHSQYRLIPVKVPALFQEPVVFIEAAANGGVIDFVLAVITEDEEKSIIGTIYNFTDSVPNKFGTYDVANLATIKPEDLRHERGCVMSYEFVAKGLIVGSWPDCDRAVNGVHPSFSLMFSCDYHAFIPLLVGEPPVTTSFRKHRFGPRFPLINAPDNYVSPCEKNY